VTEWQTDPQKGLRVGAALIAAILLVVGGLLGWIFTQPVTIWTFVAGMAVLASVGAVLLLVYWIVGLLASGYALDRNVLVISWGANEQVIPAGQIARVIPGSELEARVRFRGMHWPGYWMGYGQVEGLGPALFYATVPPSQQIFVVTEGLVYGISPEEPEAFLNTLRTRLQMGPTQIVEPSSSGPAFLQWGFWRDRLGQGLLVVGLIAVLALFGLVSARLPTLPRLLPLHFDAAGQPDRVGPQAQIFFVPSIGLIVLLLNAALGGVLYRRERFVAHLLWAGALLVQILFWAAVLGILAAV
jgi:hypothetical protein